MRSTKTLEKLESAGFQRDSGLVVPESSTGLVMPNGMPVPKALEFEVREHTYFAVEFAEKGADIIYHFWPPSNGDNFCEVFSECLEIGFQEILPESADVRATYTDQTESAVLLRFSEAEGKLSQEDVPPRARETYFVRVVGGTEYPLADIFLKGRVFLSIEKAIKEKS